MKINKMHMHKTIILENIISSLTLIFVFTFALFFEQITELENILNEVKEYMSITIILLFIVCFIIITLICFIVSYLIWRNTYIYIDDNFHLESGKIFKKHIKIHLNDIATISTKKNILERIFRTSHIKLELNAGGNDTINRKIVLLDSDVELIQNIVFNKENIEEKEITSLVSYSPEQIFKHLFFSANFISLIIGIIFLIPALYYLIDESVFIITVVLIIMGITFIWDSAKKYFDYHNFKLWHEDDKIKISYGLFVNYKYEIPKNKINAVIISQSLQARLCDKYVIKIVNAGVGNEEGEKTILCLYSEKKEIDRILKEILPDFINKERKVKQPSNSLITYLINKVPLMFIVAIICMFLPKWLLIIDLLFVIWSIIQYKTKTLEIGDNLITSTSGFFEKESVTIKYSKITLIEIKDTLIGKLYNLKYIKFNMIGSLYPEVVVAGYFNQKTENKILNNYY